ncbi:MAG: hypothetical protein IJ387_13725, partial [Thermoguttaceae bacterium]|nr:hypothetical protein [Thermoguttaceae bacterium]
ADRRPRERALRPRRSVDAITRNAEKYGRLNYLNFVRPARDEGRLPVAFSQTFRRRTVERKGKMTVETVK